MVSENELNLDKIKINNVKVVKEVSDNQYEFGFKLNKKEFKGSYKSILEFLFWLF